MRQSLLKFRSLVHTYVNRRRYLKVQACLGWSILSSRGSHPNYKPLPYPPPELGSCGCSEVCFLACPLGHREGWKEMLYVVM